FELRFRCPSSGSSRLFIGHTFIGDTSCEQGHFCRKQAATDVYSVTACRLPGGEQWEQKQNADNFHEGIKHRGYFVARGNGIATASR
ncbi:unnamed protein product, partial [Amoebophrya sp. A25]